MIQNTSQKLILHIKICFVESRIIYGSPDGSVVIDN
jgi:hypothetical protein